VPKAAYLWMSRFAWSLHCRDGMGRGSLAMELGSLATGPSSLVVMRGSSVDGRLRRSRVVNALGGM
jgi:hypothetical protein